VEEETEAPAKLTPEELERKERRARQLSKIARESILSTLEKASLAGSALDAGVETYARKIADRYSMEAAEQECF
jgi:hypothetical protein